MLKAWDAYGRICEIPREEWRTKVLPFNFQKAWNSPKDLQNLIDASLSDGFFADCLEPARQHCRIAPESRHAINQLAFVLIKLNQLDEAEKLLAAAINRLGKDSLFFNNLAKVHSGRGNSSLVERALWDSLESDPNVENSCNWYIALHRDSGGEPSADEAARRVAQLPGSWRAQLWLAGRALQSRQLERALVLYQDALNRASRPLPADLLKNMSGDLGNAGHLPEILQLVAPHFEAPIHGIGVGNNLIKAHLDLGQLPAARRVLDQLYAQKRTDWKELLAYWDTELAKARIATADEPAQPLSIGMLSIQGPVWLKPDSPAAELFPAKTPDAPTVAILGFAAEVATNSQRVQRQLSDQSGRMSRALPLFLAEQIEFRSDARITTLGPWMAGDSPGFVVCGAPWKDGDAANYARQDGQKSDYAVNLFIRSVAEPWIIEARLIRTIDANCLATFSGSFSPTDPAPGIQAFVSQLLPILHEHAEVQLVPFPLSYQVPNGTMLPNYLLRLEQLLAVRCAGMDGVPKGFLSGEREILDGDLQLCLACPDNITTRVLLVQTLLAMKRARPDVLPEFKEKVALLQKEKPLSEPYHSVVQRLVNEAYGLH